MQSPHHPCSPSFLEFHVLLSDPFWNKLQREGKDAMVGQKMHHHAECPSAHKMESVKDLNIVNKDVKALSSDGLKWPGLDRTEITRCAIQLFCQAKLGTD